ncbi:MAG: sulfatase-like hydrolase/transferase [Candidatus Glassbacteria bacterium]|nr:sulfatase-like hydrolase/transferase [Candidatus Glassbacteria bacterium]
MKNTRFPPDKKLSRRGFLEYTGAGLACALVQSCAPGKPGPQEERLQGRPNIVLIIGDDIGWHDVSYHGSEVRTPNLDRMARSGVELDQFYACPTCSPTRAAVLMGRPPSRFGILGPIALRSELALPVGSSTLASVFGDAGYHCAQIGKWHLGLRPETGPRKYGFASSYGYLHGQIDQFTHIYKNGDRSWHRNEQFFDEEGHATDLIAAEAISQITNRDRSKPLFLYVAFSVPHYPLQEEDKWVKPYENAIENASRRLFAASMTHLDDAVGRILAALDRENIADNTLVVFVSDNGGQEDWEGGPDQYEGRHGPNDRLGDNTPLRDWKGSLYEGGIRVPACLYWPGKLSPCKITAPVHAMDLLPSLADPAGVDVPAGMQVEGVDVWPLVTGSGTLPERVLYWNTGSQLALRSGNWKLVHQGGSLDEGRDELYDLAEDPYEEHDLALEKPQVLADLRRLAAGQRVMDRLAE